MFSTDADLLAYEPDVFTDLPFAAQRTLRITDGEVSAAQLTSATGGFAALSPDDVLVLNAGAPDALAMSVESVESDTSLTFTMAPVGLALSSVLTVEGRTFRPQAAVVYEELLRAVGVDPDDPASEFDGDDIVSTELMRRLEVLGTLAGAYAAAISPCGENARVERKAVDYRKRFERAIRGARVLIDTDGDGEADLWRSPGVGRLVRG